MPKCFRVSEERLAATEEKKMSSEPESKGSLGTASIPDESTRFNNSPDSWLFPLIPVKVLPCFEPRP